MSDLFVFAAFRTKTSVKATFVYTAIALSISQGRKSGKSIRCAQQRKYHDSIAMPQIGWKELLSHVKLAI